MPSLYVDRRGVALSLDADAIAFHQGAERIATVPIAPLDRVYLRGDIRLSSSLLGRLGARGIGVVILSGRRGIPSLMLPRPHNDAEIRMAQFTAARCNATALGIAQWLVAGKIRAQHQLLHDIRSARPDLGGALANPLQALFRMRNHATHKDDISALRGLEGAAAAHFFAGYKEAFAPSLGFHQRNRRPPRDPVNAALSLSYTLLHAEAVLAAHGHGLDPWIGFLHSLHFGRESLACDLVEPLRATMEHFVWRLFAEQHLRSRDFTKEKDGACLMQKAGRSRFYAMIDTPLSEARRRLEQMLAALRQLLLGKVSDMDAIMTTESDEAGPVATAADTGDDTGGESETVLPDHL